MIKKIGAIVFTLLIISPVAVSADIVSDLQAQIQALLAQIAAMQNQPTTPPSIGCATYVETSNPNDPDPCTFYVPGTSTQPSLYCPNITKNLERGSRHAQVVELQRFLSGYFQLDEDTLSGGFFGATTRKYLIQFQKQNGLPGEGNTGPRTRAKIKEVCSPRPVCPQVMPPQCENGSLVSLGQDQNGCSRGYRCDTQVQCPIPSCSAPAPCAPGYRSEPSTPVYSEQGCQVNHCASTCVPISNESIRVTVPNGGEQWEAGTMNTVTWAPYGYNPDINPPSDVIAYLMNNPRAADADMVGIIIPSGKASIHWQGEIQTSPGNVSFAKPGKYWVKIINKQTNATDTSDAAFTITPKSVDLKINGSDGPVSVTSNERVTLTWTATGVARCEIHNAYPDTSRTSQIGAVALSGTREAYLHPNAGPTLYCYKSDGSARYDSVPINSTAPIAAALRVTSPNGGEQINPASNLTGSFTFSGLTSYSAALYKNDQWLYWIARDNSLPAGGGSQILSWQSPKDAIPTLGIGDNAGAIFKIYITGQKSDGTGYVDDKSDAPFSFAGVVPPLPAVPTSWINTPFNKTSTNSCAGAQYVGFSKKYSAWVGAQLCGGADTYKLYMSSTQSGTYYEIEDSSGHGQDHCELVNPSFTIVNGDDVTSGSCKTCSIKSGYVDRSGLQVFMRSQYGEAFTKTTCGTWTCDIYPEQYKCGVNIGDGSVTPPPPTTQPICGLYRGGTSQATNMIASPNPAESVADTNSACIQYCDQSGWIAGDMCMRGTTVIKTYAASPTPTPTPTPTVTSQSYKTPGTFSFVVPSFSTLTVKAWGAGGSGGKTGVAGGASSFNLTVVAGGGAGGTSNKSTRSAGGVARGGDINLSGGTGDPGIDGARGGASPYGGAGGRGGKSTAPGSRIGGMPGGGGGGGDGGCSTEGGAGGGGSYSEKTYSAGQLPSSATVVVGAGGVDRSCKGGTGGSGEVSISWTPAIVIVPSPPTTPPTPVGAINVSVAAAPAAQTMVASVTGVTVAAFNFDATQSGEDVRFTSQKFQYSETLAPTDADITNCFAYDGITRLSNSAVNPTTSGNESTFTFDTNLVVAKGTVKAVTVKCDLPAALTGGSFSWGVDISEIVPGIGVTSGQSVTPSGSDNNGNTMTLAHEGGGTLIVSLDPASPQYRIVAVGTGGATGVTLGALRFSGTAQDIRLERVALQLSGTTESSPSNIVQLTLWDGATQVGTAIFAGSRNTVSTLTGTVVIPADGSKTLTIKGDFAGISLSSAGTPGALIRVDYDNDDAAGTRGIGQSSGLTVIRTSTSDTNVAGVRTQRSVPIITYTASAGALTNGTQSLATVNISTDTRGDVQIHKLTFRVSASDATLSSPTFSGPNGSVGNITYDGSKVTITFDSSINSSDKIIPAGGSKMYTLAGTIAGLTGSNAGVISISLAGDASESPMAPVSSVIGNIIWSPQSVTSAVTASTADWTNGYGLGGCFAVAGLGQDCTSISKAAMANTNYLANALSALQEALLMIQRLLRQ